MMRKRLSLFATTFLSLSLAAFAAERPKLVVFISVDQMRADYLDRFRNDFTGGLKRLMSEGTVYDNANLNYAPSETGPGHASLATGCYPWKSGILSNDWIDPATRKDVYCVQDTLAEKTEGEGGGVSARNLRVTAIGDWLQQASPGSKVIAISAKDRAAILMGGQHPTEAFWYDHSSGHMVTSDYYADTIPGWVRSFNASDWIDRNLPPAWTKLKEDDWYAKAGPDEMKGERPWNGTTTFPHVFSADKKKDQLLKSPYGDRMVLDFGLAAVRSERLGMRGVVDLLCISLSCTDYIGHDFGPNSQEMADQILRLDQALGSFIDGAEQVVGKGNVLIALSADHAVLPLPEFTVGILHQYARRIIPQTEINPAVDSLDRVYQREFRTSEHILRTNGFLNYAAASAAGADSLTLERRVRDDALRINGIADIYFRREIINPATPERPYLDYYRHGYYPPRGEDFLVRFCENCLVRSSPTGTTHGSPYVYDTHVPVVFWGTGVKAGSVQRPIHSVDIAPTLITLLGYAYPASIDGVPLREIAHK